MRKTKTQKISEIEKKMEELREQKIKMMEELYVTIGKTLEKEWDSIDIDSISFALKTLKDEAVSLIEVYENGSANKSDEEPENSTVTG